MKLDLAKYWRLSMKELEKIKNAKAKCKKYAEKLWFKVKCNKGLECNEDCPFLKYLEEN